MDINTDQSQPSSDQLSPAQAPAQAPPPSEAMATAQAQPVTAPGAPAQPGATPEFNRPSAPQPVQGQQAIGPKTKAQEIPAHANIFRSVMESLAGSKPTYKVDQYGDMKEIPAPPMSKSRLSMGIVAGALSGMLTGMQHTGPNAFGAGAADAMQTKNAEMEKQKQQAQQQASQDYTRQAQTTKANMETLMNQIQAGRMSREEHEAAGKDSQEMIDDINRQPNAADTIGATKASEAESKDLTKFPIHDWLRIPNKGAVPSLDPTTGEQAKDKNGVPQWENTFTMVKKNGKTSVNDESGKPMGWVGSAANWNIPGAKALQNAAPGTKIPAPMAASMMQQATRYDLAQSELNNFTQTFKDKDGKSTVPDINLKDELTKNPNLSRVLEMAQKAAPGSVDLHDIVTKMQGDPQAAPYAAQLINLVGAKNFADYAETKKLASEEREGEQKNALEGKKETLVGPIKAANQAAEDKLRLPGEIAKAGATAGAAASARVAAENTPGALQAEANKAGARTRGAEQAKVDIATAPFKIKDAQGNPTNQWNKSSSPVKLAEGDMEQSQLKGRGTIAQLEAFKEAADKYSMETYGKPVNWAMMHDKFKDAQNPQNRAAIKNLTVLAGQNSKTGDPQGSLHYLNQAAQKLGNTTIPAINDANGWLALQAHMGNTMDVTKFRAALLETKEAGAKVLVGTNVLTDKALSQLDQMLDKGNTADQILGVTNTMADQAKLKFHSQVDDNPFLLKEYTKEGWNPGMEKVLTGGVGGETTTSLTPPAAQSTAPKMVKSNEHGMVPSFAVGMRPATTASGKIVYYQDAQGKKINPTDGSPYTGK